MIVLDDRSYTIRLQRGDLLYTKLNDGKETFKFFHGPDWFSKSAWYFGEPTILVEW